VSCTEVTFVSNQFWAFLLWTVKVPIILHEIYFLFLAKNTFPILSGLNYRKLKSFLSLLVFSLHILRFVQFVFKFAYGQGLVMQLAGM